MCLSNISKKKIAEEDIPCYKELEVQHKNRLKFIPEDGSKFKGTIYGLNCTGKISVQKGQVYFCTNHSRLYGKSCTNKHGYENSCVMSNRVSSIFINGEQIVEIENLQYITPYRGVYVEVGKTYTSKIKVYDNRVGKALHSYINIPERNFNCIAKCIIPKGAKYYIGDFEGTPAYASDKLMYVEII